MNTMPSFNTLTSALGAGLVLYVSYKLLDTARLYTRPSSLHRYLYTDASGQRAWALITGSSNGIGKRLAFELANHGFNIIIHGRNPDKLETVRMDLLAAHPNTEVRVVVADASQCHRREVVDFDRLREELAHLHLTVLINCAGAGPKPAFGALEAYSTDEILENLHLNAAFPTLLTAALMPVLKGQQRCDPNHTSSANATQAPPRSRRQQPALIINIGSVTDDGFPLVSFYSAGKAATHALHKALAREAALDGWGEDIEVISHRVGAVTGVSHTREPPTLFRPDAQTVAKAILARTGCGRNIVVPYWPHALQQGLLALMPKWVVDGTIITAMREERRVQDEKLKKS